jgi:hypothetical protein
MRDDLDGSPTLTARTRTILLWSKPMSDCYGLRNLMGRERADVILIAVSKFIDTLRVARRCRAIIMQNFVGALVVDGTMAALAC